MTKNNLGYKAQSGVVLVISLIMLMLLTMIAVNATQSTTLEEKMAGNLRDQNLAFQAAESALSAAEATLVPVAPAVLPNFTAGGVGGFYDKTAGALFTDAVLSQSNFWTANPNLTATSTLNNLGNNVAAPKYIIEKLVPTCFKGAACTADPADKSQPYRITVRATGASTNSVVLVQSIFTP